MNVLLFTYTNGIQSIVIISGIAPLPHVYVCVCVCVCECDCKYGKSVVLTVFIGRASLIIMHESLTITTDKLDSSHYNSNWKF